MSTRKISEAAQALGRRGGRKSLGAKSKAELSAFGKAAAEKRWKKAKPAEKPKRCEAMSGPVGSGYESRCFRDERADDQHEDNQGQRWTAQQAQLPVFAPKPKRPLPKAGTMAARVLLEIEALSVAGLAPLTSERIALHAGMVGIGNILSSLRSAGHVVSIPKPGSRREKLWRLA